MNSPLSFQIGETCIQLLGDESLLKAVLPFLSGFPLRSTTPPIQLKVQQKTTAVPTCPLDREPILTHDNFTWTIHHPGLYRLQVNLNSQQGELILSRNTSLPNEPPKELWLALKALVSLHTLIEGGLLVHASAISLEGHGLFFPGISGAGKSTLAGMFPPNDIINDDIVILHPNKNRLWVISTPFTSTQNITRRHTAAPAAGALGLHQAPEVMVTALNQRDAIRLLLRCTIIPSMPTLERVAFDRCLQFVERCFWARLSFNLNAPQVIHALHAHLTSQSGEGAKMGNHQSVPIQVKRQRAAP